jgi:hypothetical protein
MSEQSADNILSDGPLTSTEKALLAEYKKMFPLLSKQERHGLPTKFMNIWLGNSATVLVRHLAFSNVMEIGRKKHALAEERRQAEIIEQAKRDADEQIKRRAKRYFDFWFYRGIVYGGQKYWDGNGQSKWRVIQFFLQRKDKADEEIKLHRYDLPIANGQEVAVIYSRLKGQKSGFAVVYCNYNTRQNITLDDDARKVANFRPSSSDGISYTEELNEFMKRAGLN